GLATIQNAASRRRLPRASRSAARQHDRYATRARSTLQSQVTHLYNLILNHAAGGLDRDDVAFFLADQCPGNRRAYRNLAYLDVSFILTHDLIHHRFVCINVGDFNGGTKDHLPGMWDRGGIDYLGIRQPTFDVTNSR